MSCNFSRSLASISFLSRVITRLVMLCTIHRLVCSFGIGQTGKRTGIIFNTGMNDFAVPNMPNYFGLPPSPGNFIRPKKRAMSSMSPSILARTSNGDVQLIIGASGGTKIPTAITWVCHHKKICAWTSYIAFSICSWNARQIMEMTKKPKKFLFYFRWSLVYCGLAKILNKLSMHHASITNFYPWKSITNMEIHRWEPLPFVSFLSSFRSSSTSCPSSHTKMSFSLHIRFSNLLAIPGRIRTART